MPARHTHALVLTAAPNSGDLAARALTLVRELVAERLVAETSLGAGEAWQAQIVAQDEADAAGLGARVRSAVHRHPIDVNVVPDTAARRKQLLLADLESTIIEQECLDELGAHAGSRSEIAAITARAMRGELAFEEALRARVGLLAGLDATALQEVASRITLMPGAQTLVATMRRYGARCALVSGGFAHFARPVATRLGFEAHFANTLEIAAGRLTGAVAEPVLGRAAKRDALLRLAGQWHIAGDRTLAVGDGANDLAMLEAASLGVAFRAKPAVAAAARASIRYGDLSAILYLQGYTRAEFAS
jgi:phosphoserine phosphatase